MNAARAAPLADRFANQRELLDTLYGASVLMNEIAEIACQLDALLARLISDAATSEPPAPATIDAAVTARMLCCHIGWISDRAADSYGGGPIRGDADAWLLAPDAAKALAAVDARLGAGGAP